ncbi:MAG: NUDIX hydrolase [Candidatus Eremiobacteraeota bacterium]|nr:NUDIX hydrolase [Candidatus Eremiobacteraeota bacterium]
MRVRRERIETPRGDVVEGYHIRETRGFVVIFALAPSGDAILVRQYKHGIGDEVLELPGGAIDPGESAEAAARREFSEETGYTLAADLERIGTFVIDPTNSNGRFSLFFSGLAEQTHEPHFDPTEEIAVELVSLDRLRELVREGTIDVAFHVAAIYRVLDRLGRLD